MAALTASAGEHGRFEAVEPVMGTLFRVTLYAPNAGEARESCAAAFARARQIEAILSDYAPESELNRLCRLGRARVSPDLLAVLEHAQCVARQTGGAFDITLGPLTRLWREARRSGRMPHEEEIRAARGRTGWKKLIIENGQARLTVPGMQLDAGGIGKGYAADQMLAVLRARGISSALIAAGGDLVIGDPPPGRDGWRITLDPGGGRAPAARSVRTIRNLAVSTSGGSEQFVESGGMRYSHILDPRRGLGLRNTPAVTVVAPRGVEADALATAFSVLGPIRTRKWVETRGWITVFFHETID